MDDTMLRELRQDILEEVEDMDIEMLKRIAYEVRCEENGIYPDQTYIRWWSWLKHKCSRWLQLLHKHMFSPVKRSSKFLLMCVITC